MSSTKLPLHGLLARTSLIAGSALMLAVLLAWAWLIAAARSDHSGMTAMIAEPWSAAYLLGAFVMWALMMVAMMLPSAAPMLLLHARIDRAPTERQRLLHTLTAALAYLLIWAGFSAAAALGQALLVDTGLVSAVQLTVGQRGLAAAILVFAALYQLSPAKQACLDQCRAPLHFIMRYRSPGAAGALRLGAAHGLYCVGCCWGLMLLLFVAGVMNVAWIALIAAVVLVEKLAPAAWHARQVIAALLLAGAAATLAVA